MRLETTMAGGRMVVRVPGPRLDAAAAPAFRHAMATLVEETTADLVLDFEAVAFIDSAGLGAVVGCLRRIKSPRRITLARLTPAVARVFALTRMDKVFRIDDVLSA